MLEMIRWALKIPFCRLLRPAGVQDARCVSRQSNPGQLPGFIQSRQRVISISRTCWFIVSMKLSLAACGSVVVDALCYKSEGRGFETRWCEPIFLKCLILPAALDPEVYSASNINYYQKQGGKFWGVKCGRRVRSTNSPPSMSRLSRQRGIVNISQSYRTPWPVMGIDLFFYLLY
jgi:hypothetical protein